MAAAKPVVPVWLRLSGSCMPCAHGCHAACRHRPDEGRRGQFSRADSGEPCGCEKRGHPTADTCRDGRMDSGGWSYRICGKPAKGTATVTEFDHEFEQPLCGVHLAGLRRRVENEARWRAEWAARDEADERDRQLRAASVEWARRLADEFGVDAQPHQGRAHGELRVEVQPERLYALLVAAAAALAEVGYPWESVTAEVA